MISDERKKDIDTLAKNMAKATAKLSSLERYLNEESGGADGMVYNLHSKEYTIVQGELEGVFAEVRDLGAEEIVYFANSSWGFMEAMAKDLCLFSLSGESVRPERRKLIEDYAASAARSVELLRKCEELYDNGDPAHEDVLKEVTRNERAANEMLDKLGEMSEEEGRLYTELAGENISAGMDMLSKIGSKLTNDAMKKVRRAGK